MKLAHVYICSKYKNIMRENTVVWVVRLRCAI